MRSGFRHSADQQTASFGWSCHHLCSFACQILRVSWWVPSQLQQWPLTNCNSKLKLRASHHCLIYEITTSFYESVMQYVDEILKCVHSNESYRAVIFCGTVYYAVQGSSNFWVCVWNPKVWPLKSKLLSSTFLWYCLLCCTRWFYILSPWTKSHSVTIQIKASKQFFPVVLFIIQYKVILKLIHC